jgi:sulfur carrier protein ThiS
MKLTVNGLTREVAAGTSVEQLVAAVHGGMLAPGTHAPPTQPPGQRRTGRARPPARPATGRPGSGIVLTLNGAVIPRSTWTRIELSEGDTVEVLSADPAL